jgi:hypothetical protein
MIEPMAFHVRRTVLVVLALASGIVIATAQSITPVPRPQQGQPPQAGVSGPQTAAVPRQPVATQTEVSRKGKPNSDVFLGIYLSLDRECKIGEAPKVTYSVEPKFGKMRTRPHPVNLRDVPGAPRRTCIGTSPNGLAVLYRADRRFKGEEKINFRLTYPNGDTRDVSATVMVE